MTRERAARRRRLALAAAITALVCQHASRSHAQSSVGSFHYRVPVGWTTCPDSAALCAPSGKARLRIEAPVAGSDPAPLARARAPGRVLTDQSSQIGANAAHVVVAVDGESIAFSIATTAGGGVRVTLTGPAGEAQAAVHGWIAVVQGGIIGAPPAVPPGGPAIVALRNQSRDCVAHAWLDGAEVQVAAGATHQATLAHGRHLVEWNTRDGSMRIRPVDVPDITSLDIACPAAAPPAQAGSDDPVHAKRRAMFAGARAAVMFYRTLWNLAASTKPWPRPKSLDRLMLKLVKYREPARRADLEQYVGHLHVLDAAVAKSAKQPASRAALVRLAVRVLIRAGQVRIAHRCRSAAETPEARKAELDCTIKRLANLGTDAADEVSKAFRRLADVEPPAGTLVDELRDLAE